VPQLINVLKTDKIPDVCLIAAAFVIFNWRQRNVLTHCQRIVSADVIKLKKMLTRK